MLDQRPYFINAVYSWICDSNCTPYILVWVDDKTIVPMQSVKDGKIVLNISMIAAPTLHIGKDAITFGARFSQKHYDIFVPIKNVLGIYARENGQGIFFEEADKEVTYDLTNFVVDKLSQMLGPEGKPVEMNLDFSGVEQKKPEDKPPTKPTLKVVK